MCSSQSILYLHGISINASDSSDKDFLLILHDTLLHISVIYLPLSSYLLFFHLFTHLLNLLALLNIIFKMIVGALERAVEWLRPLVKTQEWEYCVIWKLGDDPSR